MLRNFLVLLLLSLPATACCRQGDKAVLLSKIRAITDTLEGKVGVGLMGLDFKESLLLRNGHRFPMQSVYKLPLAIYMLSKVDQGVLSPDQVIHISRASLMQDTWSPMLKDFKEEEINMTLADLLLYSVSKSDNNACDILFKIAGGTGPVDAYFRAAGIKGMAIAATEKEMGAAWDVQYTNWCRPSAMLQVLKGLYEGKFLRPSSRNILMKLMEESENSPNRIKGLLPEGTEVAHKTGTSNTNAGGIKAATNDVGIVTLPDGSRYALVIFVSDHKGGVAVGERIIAAISKAVWDHYTLNRP